MTKYTQEQIQEFKEFCKRHDLQFGNLTEYHAALAQYFEG